MGDDDYTLTQPDLDFTFDTAYDGEAVSTGGQGTFTVGIQDSIYSTSDNGLTVSLPGQDPDVNHKLEARLDAIEKRLGILVPDPKKLEKFEALKKAYAHYKDLERLCEIEEEQQSGS
jgi:hypothetical protein